MSIQVITASSQEEASKNAGELLVSLCTPPTTPILLLLSGGSVCSLLDACEFTTSASHITMTMLDERFSDNLLRNNYHKVSETRFVRSLVAHGAHPVPTLPYERWTLDEFVARLNTAVVSWKRENPHGKVYAVQGIGSDGHTAGIMPFVENKEQFDQLFVHHMLPYVGYDACAKNEIPLRVTVTTLFLTTSVDHSLVFACGESKQEALQKSLSKESALHEVPASVLTHMKQVTVFTDILL